MTDDNPADRPASKTTDREALRARWTAAGIPDPLPWRTLAETGRHLADVKDAPWEAKIWCRHPKKPGELIGVVTRDRVLVTDDSLEAALTYVDEPVTASCPGCSGTKGLWVFRMNDLRARVESGRKLDDVAAAQVADRYLPPDD